LYRLISVDSSQLFLIARWIIPLWLLGRFMLPLSRHVFPNLPDGGLAAGRIGWLVAATLLAFWGASLYTLPLWLSPLWLLGGPLLIFALTWRDANKRAEFRDWMRQNQRALWASDAVFVATFAFFLWVRLRNPALSDLEKPMDAALMGAASRATFLPFENPWLAGVPFTNYYYFGPLMSGLLLRVFATPVFDGYNLVQPLFCALFVSTLWSLGAAIAGSLWRGVVVASVVALFGHFEPLRQMREAGKPLGISEINWWSTSRVVPDTNEATRQIVLGSDGKPQFWTINEYPLFTLSIGDAHAHFYALSLAALLLCLCWSLFAPQSTQSTLGRLTHRRWVLLALGALLGAIVLTNTWDAPFYALLVLLCAIFTRPKYFDGDKGRANWRESACCALPLLLAPVVALPYLRTLQSPVKDPNRKLWQFELWLPPLDGFALFWGGFLTLWLLAFAAFWISRRAQNGDEVSRTTSIFLGFLSLCGFGALLSPSLFYINGFFGGDLRHQDTVFKFYLQAWILLGVAASGGALWMLAQARLRWRRALGALWIAVWCAPFLCAGSVLWMRAVGYAPKNSDGSVTLSLDGSFPRAPGERDALQWLWHHATRGDVVLEAFKPGSYHEFGRVSALTGVSTPLGWSQHVGFWGADNDGPEIEPRRILIESVWNWPDDATALAALKELNVRYVFVGDVERRIYRPEALQRLQSTLKPAFTSGATTVLQVPR